MRLFVYVLVLLLIACKSDPESSTPEKKEDKAAIIFSKVSIEEVYKNDSLSIRAITVIGENLAFAGNNGVYGLYHAKNHSTKINVQKKDSLKPEFRAVANTATDFFILSVGNPALLYKTGDAGKMELVYTEENENVFYDAMNFWNDREGIAMGDPTENCLSIIITRDGGKSWYKLACKDLPEIADGEAAFAASNSNIAIQGDKTWILSGGKKSRVFYSEDKGKSWQVFETPLIQGESTSGGYSMDFYDEKNGFIIGGDYTKPEVNQANKAGTQDGGKTWKLVGEGMAPGYKSSIRYIPGSKGRGLIATGFTGIHYSKDAGKTWNKLSKEGFYTLRFINDTLAYAAGKGRIAKLTFK